ncbi:MAG: transposase [Pseudoprimorskyibacter sp.]|nr:transposase [Pseudoprimorskyibacter sp.]
MKTEHPIIVGIDTNKASHVAVAIDTQGTRLAALSILTNPKGYLELERWSLSLGQVVVFGIERTGSYGQTVWKLSIGRFLLSCLI